MDPKHAIEIGPLAISLAAWTLASNLLQTTLKQGQMTQDDALRLLKKSRQVLLQGEGQNHPHSREAAALLTKLEEDLHESGFSGH